MIHTFLLLHDSHIHSCCCMIHTYILVVACFTPSLLLLHVSHLHSCCCSFHAFIPVVAYFRLASLLLHISDYVLHPSCCMFHTYILVVACFTPQSEDANWPEKLVKTCKCFHQQAVFSCSINIYTKEIYWL